MQTISGSMTADHRRCDEMFASAEESVASGDWKQGSDRFETFRRTAEHHFVMEEDILFPRFEEATGQMAGPTQVMRMEHVQMRQLFGEMQAALVSRQADEYLGLSETLMMIMQQHNMKEEQMLYPMMDRVLAGRESDLIREMNRLGERIS